MSNVYHFMTFRVKRTQMRKIAKEDNKIAYRSVVDYLHNLRYQYDWWGFWMVFRRSETRRRYYKRVRADAPKASILPKEINSIVDLIRQTRQPAVVLDFSHGKAVLHAREERKAVSHD